MQRDAVGAAQQVVQLDLLDADVDRALLGQEGIIGDHLHPQALRTAGNDAADIARTDQAERLAGELDAHVVALGPFARLGARVRLRDLAGEREQHGNRVFGGGDRVAEGRVHHHHAALAGGRDIDVVDPDPGAADDLEIGRGFEDFGRDFGRGSDRKTLIFADNRFQFVGRKAGLLVHFAAALRKNLGGIGAHLVGNQDFGFGHGNTPTTKDRSP